MAMFEKFRDKAMTLAEAGVNKAKEVGEIAKLNLAIATETENMKKAYAEIGRQYYESSCHNPDPAYADLFRKVSECKAKIELHKARIAAIKADDKQADTTNDAAQAFVGVDADVPPEEPEEPSEPAE